LHAAGDDFTAETAEFTTVQGGKQVSVLPVQMGTISSEAKLMGPKKKQEKE